MKRSLKLFVVLLCSSMLFCCGNSNGEANKETNNAAIQKAIEETYGAEILDSGTGEDDSAYIYDTFDSTSVIIEPFDNESNELFVYGESTEADISFVLVYDTDKNECIGTVTAGEIYCMYDITNKQAMNECDYMDDSVEILNAAKDYLEGFLSKCGYNAKEILDFLRWYHEDYNKE